MAQCGKMEEGNVLSYHLPWNLLTCMQVMEYDRSFLASRILLDSFNGNLIISGAFGLFKKDIAVAVGGYDANTLGEDMELVVKLQDVYKRQVSNRNYERWLKRAEGSRLVLLELGVGYNTPVSYTHLDVYKRQAVWRRAYFRTDSKAACEAH